MSNQDLILWSLTAFAVCVLGFIVMSIVVYKIMSTITRTNHIEWWWSLLWIGLICAGAFVALFIGIQAQESGGRNEACRLKAASLVSPETFDSKAYEAYLDSVCD